jgi:hypothetical protein
MNAEHETPEWLKFVDHTADAGIAVEAPDLVRLFERAAWGMFSVITDVAAARSTKTSRISIDAPAQLAGGLLWEHYHSDWSVDWEYNRNDKTNIFRPWGYQPGHRGRRATSTLARTRSRPIGAPG